MRWIYKRNDEQLYADWSPNGFVSNDHLMNLTVQNLVTKKHIVACGIVGPNLPASLVNEVAAWGTIMTALSLMGPLTVFEAPECPVKPEPTMMPEV